MPAGKWNVLWIIPCLCCIGRMYVLWCPVVSWKVLCCEHSVLWMVYIRGIQLAWWCSMVQVHTWTVRYANRHHKACSHAEHRATTNSSPGTLGIFECLLRSFDTFSLALCDNSSAGLAGRFAGGSPSRHLGVCCWLAVYPEGCGRVRAIPGSCQIRL